ncbi:MAG TPA: TonB-dependent receptor [Candidatus Acidoferrum sp.]|nr:TonB-dependent receptor [Candidatus Acidoferrum sp.]
MRLTSIAKILMLAVAVCIGEAARAQDGSAAPPSTPPLGADASASPTSGEQDGRPAAQTPEATAAPRPITYQIAGSVHSGKTALPGVVVTAANTLTGKKFSGVTATDGTFYLTGLPRGRYVVRVEFMGFATATQEVVLNPENTAGKVDVEMLLASRQEQQTNAASAALTAAGRGFQNLALDSALSSLSGGAIAAGQPTGAGDVGALPLNGAGADAPTESVSITGAQGRTQDFGAGNEDELQQRIQEFRERAQREGLLGGGGGPGGGGGAFGGPGGGGIFSIGRLPQGFNVNQPHGFLYFSDDNASLDAAPYALLGRESQKASYNQARFGANIGGPLNIPKLFNGGNKTFFFFGWNGTRGSTPYDSFSNVATVPERGGDFSALLGAPVVGPNGAQVINQCTGQPVLTGQIFDPTTIRVVNGQTCSNPFPGNRISSPLSTEATSLLNYIPRPNAAGASQNFHYVTSDESNSDAISVRLIHNFAGGRPGAGPFGGGGRGGNRGPQNNLNFALNYSRTSANLVNAFPSLAGGTDTQGLNASAGWTYGKGRLSNTVRVTYNHNHVSTTNLYSNIFDVAGDAGIGGISSAPFDWGLPGISFSSFSGLSDPTPQRELDQTYTFADTVTWHRGTHNLRLGADYRRILQSFRSAKNAEGGFVFTGFATALGGDQQANPGTGSDFADFLLGFPQQSSIQTVKSGTDAFNFRSNSYDFFAQDDWRWRPSLTINAGLRYEYYGPYTETGNRIANLDVAPNFSAASLVLPGGTGAFYGSYPDSLVRPDRNNFAPRIGIAWKPPAKFSAKTVVRAGYGINYNLAQYGTIIQNFAFQPPFAETATNISAAPGALTLANGFPPINSNIITNNFAVDPNYRLGYVQVWNVNVQKEVAGGVVINVGYNGAKGTHLDLERALEISGLQPFIYESSEGNSILHAGTFSVRKRLAKGIGLGATYVFSKSIDNAGSIGGGAVVVAQNPFDISADRGLSSFDQRHKITGNWIYQLPLGDNHRFASSGAAAHILGNWQWSGDFTVASGLPFTPHVLGNTLDINRGVSGSLRANYVVGQSIGVTNQSATEWFNVNAFCVPQTTASGASGTVPTCVNPSDSPYGDVGRDIIEGPGQFTVDMSISKTFVIKEFRALEFRVTASNVFNTVQYTSIGSVLNSPSFGEVTSTGNMRRVAMYARFRF